MRTNHIVIGLGGTISLALCEDRAVPGGNAETLLVEATLGGLDGNWSAEQLMAVNSSDLTPSDIASVALHIAEKVQDMQGVVVTTGTDTLEEVAYGLSLLLGRSANVIVTGAMRPPYAPDFDGVRNLHAAARLSEQRAQDGETGVVIAIGGAVLAPSRMVKTSTHSLNAFSSCSDPDEDRENDGVAGRTAITPDTWRDRNIPILSMVTGYRFDPAILTAADGLVVACPGYASLSKMLFSSIAEWIEQTGLPVVLASRCHDSAANLDHIYPGYLDRAESAGFQVRAYLGLTPEKARLRLMFRMNGIVC